MKVRTKTIKLSKENIRERLHNIGFGEDFTNMTPNHSQQKKKMDFLESIIIKTSVYLRTLLTESTGNPHNGRNYLQTIYLIRD